MEQKQTIWSRIWAFLAATWTRFKEKTPAYFKVLRQFFIGLFAFCLAFQEKLVEQLNKIKDTGLVPEEWISNLTSYLAVAAAMGAIMTFLPVDPHRVPEEKYEKLKDPTSNA